MDRRQFLKAGALGTAGVALASTPLQAKKKAEVSKTPLKSQGFVTEPARQISVVDSADVVVVGGGPAGFAAALAAVREGASAVILERQYFLGGLFTGCGVTPIINMYHPTETGRVQAIYGIADELVKEMEKTGSVLQEKVRPNVDPEAAKYYMEEMLLKDGVRIIYGVQAAQIIMSGNEIKDVIVEGKSGRVAIACKFVIDCSGDGDILEWAGEDFNVYKNDIGAMWRIGNAAASKVGNITCIKNVRGRHSVGEKDQDGLDMYNLTRVQISERKKMWNDAQKLKQQEGCGDLFLLDTPAVVGVRITRVLNSVANVTAEGAATGKTYKDVIGFTGGHSTLKYGDVKIRWQQRKMWQIPYSSITPKTVGNLLVAGRCFGFEKPLTYDSREVGTCFMTGQAAGVAAAQAVNLRRSCRDVDVAKLQERLRATNVKLDW